MYNDLINNIENKALIIFGELHGTGVIPIFYSINNTKETNLCLEIPVELQLDLDNFFNNSDKKIT